MKYVIASDIHGSAYYCRLLKERYLAEHAERLILLGDLLYHGARNPLPPEYSTLACADILNSLKEDILCVKGNCDSQVDTLVLQFPVEAELCVLPYEGRTLLLTHGHTLPALLREGDVLVNGHFHVPALLREGDVLVNGHFHVPALERRETYTYVNCGSVSIPKDGSPHSYLVFQDGELLFKNVETGEVFLSGKL